MTDLDKATDDGEVIEQPVIETKAEAPAIEVKTEQPASLDDAIKKAFESHAPEAASAKPTDPITGREVEPVKAPASLTPALREKWQTIDPQYQKWMVDRERDISTRLSQTADDRKFAAEVKKIAEPYSDMLKGFNQTATQHIDGLFKVSHLLATGNPQGKAQFIDSLIRLHLANTPDGMQWLSHFAQGGQPVAQPAPPAPQPSVDDLVAQKLAEKEAAAEEAAIAAELETFATTHEFYTDVRAQMGKIIETGLVDGKNNAELFQNAYDLACQQHPEIKAVLAQRSTTPAPKPKAVSSVKPSLGAGRSTPAPARSMSIDDAVAAAFSKHGMA